MKITVTGVLVDDQDKALKFYTEVLGFEPRQDIPLGEFRWLTVVSPGAPDGAVELLLEPNAFLPAQTYQKALVEAGIPSASFGVEDCQLEFERLSALGAVFRGPPTKAGTVTTAVLEDTCGNLIQIAQVDS